MPGWMGKIVTLRVLRIMKELAELMGAKVVDELWFGIIPASVYLKVREKDLRKAYESGKKLVR